MIKTLRRKFVLITMTLVGVVLVAVAVGIYWYFSGGLRQESYRMLEQRLEHMQGGKGPSFQIGEKAPEGFGRDPVFLMSVDADGTAQLLMSERVEVSAADLQAIADLVLASGETQGELDAYDLRYIARQNDDTLKIAATVLTLEKAQVNSLMTVTVLAVAGAFVVFLAASILLARWALRPVETAWKKQRRFVADASHELKTPLTVILANAGILKAHPAQTVGSQMAWVENTEQEARRMRALVDDMLFLAKGDDTQGTLPMARMDLSDTVATAALSFEPVAFEQGLSLCTEISRDIAMEGNAPQLKQLAGILLDNAIKYAQKGTAVTIGLKRRQDKAELWVHNLGKPVPPEAQKHLFERFYQADASRAGEGYGLGLSIAQAIVETHKGKITVESGENGTTFRAVLPAR